MSQNESTEERVEPLFPSYGGGRAVARQDLRFVGQDKEFLPHRAKEGLVFRKGQVGPSHGSGKKGVTGEENFGVGTVKGDGSNSVSGGFYDHQFMVTHGDGVSFL